ncbi:hypothetical protein DPMN_055414 [Dreissena polymorpha]|uniref:Uncharacterized protein n=1 Tax=Dreissena polymorpha TaxID=45954 RepID=A0A9D4CSC4_DREPO|nr:hypothetical protein DPMN_055414 [Dreissena polymorpha]
MGLMMYTDPRPRSIRSALQNIEAQSIFLVVEKLEKAEKEKGKMIMHIENPHIKGYQVQRLHVGQNCPFPLPILPIHQATTEDIAMQLDMRYKILALVRGVSVEDVYELAGAHLTDITEHNKGFSTLFAEMKNLEAPAWQVSCCTHTTLGFSSAMNNKVMRLVVAEMKIEKVIQSFMVDREVYIKNASVAG